MAVATQVSVSYLWEFARHLSCLKVVQWEREWNHLIRCWSALCDSRSSTFLDLASVGNAVTNDTYTTSIHKAILNEQIFQSLCIVKCCYLICVDPSLPANLPFLSGRVCRRFPDHIVCPILGAVLPRTHQLQILLCCIASFSWLENVIFAKKVWTRKDDAYDDAYGCVKKV